MPCVSLCAANWRGPPWDLGENHWLMWTIHASWSCKPNRIDWMSFAQSNFTKIIASQISCMKNEVVWRVKLKSYWITGYYIWSWNIAIELLRQFSINFSWILPELRHRETTQRQEATNNVTCRVTQEGFDRLEWAQDTRWGESYCTCMLEIWTPFLNWIFGG